MRLMRAFVVGALIVSSAVVSNATDWETAPSLSCAQFRLHGKGKRGAEIRMFEVASRKASCCDGLKPVYHGKTSWLGDFRIPKKLHKDGFYYLEFSWKGEKALLPVQLDHATVHDECDSRDFVISVADNGKVTVQQYITVD